jgi:hypothetical protein
MAELACGKYAVEGGFPTAEMAACHCDRRAVS